MSGDYLPHHPLNSLTTLGYILEVFLRLWRPTLVRVYDLNHILSLANFQWLGLFKQRMLCLTENCLQIQK